MFKTILKQLKIDEKKALHENFLFWLATLLPILTALLLSFPLIQDLKVSLSTEGYKSFITLFKLPLWVASGSILLGVMVGRFHASAQRAATIKESIAQNHFSNYLNHREHFQRYIQPIAKSLNIKVDPYKLYGIVFSNSSPLQANTTISSGIYDYFERKFEEEFWSKMKTSNPNYSKQEVNIYFPRFSKSVGINAEELELQNFDQLLRLLKTIRQIYRYAMEYGLTKHDISRHQEAEEHGLALLIGDFTQWSQNHSFNKAWR